MQQDDIICVVAANIWKLFSQLKHVSGYRSHINGLNTFEKYSLGINSQAPALLDS